MTDLRKATVAELVSVLTVASNDEWYEVNRELMDVIDRKDEAFRAISALGMDKLHAQESIVKFAERLVEDPNDAFSWGEQAIRASGTVALANEVGYWLANDVEFNFRKMIAKMTQEIIRQRGYGPESSTSGLSNLAGEYKHSAKAKWVETVCEARE